MPEFNPRISGVFPLRRIRTVRLVPLHTLREREREKKRIAVCNIRKERGNKGTSYENGVGRNGKFYEVSSFPGQR